MIPMNWIKHFMLGLDGLNILNDSEADCCDHLRGRESPDSTRGSKRPPATGCDPYGIGLGQLKAADARQSIFSRMGEGL